jgi:hypothetical protein
MTQERRAALAPEAQRKVLDALHQRHRAHLRPGEAFTCDGSMTHGDAQMELTLRDPEDEQVLRLQARVDLIANDIQSPTEGLDLAMDLLDLALQEFFDQERMTCPPQDWKEHELDGHQAWLRGRLRNLKLERMASELLNEPLEPDFDDLT